MKICSLLPTATEILYALGLGKNVVGRSEHCHYPPQVKSKPIVVRSAVKKIARQDSLEIHQAVVTLKEKGVHQFVVDTAALKQLKPDLVITQTLCTVCAASHSEVSSALKQLNPVPREIHLHAQRLSEIFKEIRRLGIITHRRSAADRLLHQLEGRLEKIRKKIAQASSRPRVWCCEWLEPLMAAGHWIPEMVESAGGMDGLGKKGADSVWLSWEQVRRYDPEVILVMPCSYSIFQTLREKNRLLSRHGWKELKAVKEGKVFAVATDYFHHTGPRLVDGVGLIAHLLHPDLIPAGPYRRHYREINPPEP